MSERECEDMHLFFFLSKQVDLTVNAAAKAASADKQLVPGETSG